MILDRRGMIPPPPQELNGINVIPEYTSIMAQAQRLVGLANTDRWLLTMQQGAELDPGILDYVNTDKIPEHYHTKLSVAADLIRDDEQVKARRMKREQDQQAVGDSTALDEMLQMAGEPT